MIDAGTHLIVDAFVRDNSVFTEKNFARLFEILADALHMQIILGPEFVSVPTNPDTFKRVQETNTFEDSGGTTAFCVVSTSHMSIHCWPLENFFSLDVFSCKKYDADKALKIIRDVLGVDRDNTHIIDRQKPCAST